MNYSLFFYEGFYNEKQSNYIIFYCPEKMSLASAKYFIEIETIKGKLNALVKVFSLEVTENITRYVNGEDFNEN